MQCEIHCNNYERKPPYAAECLNYLDVVVRSYEVVVRLIDAN